MNYTKGEWRVSDTSFGRYSTYRGKVFGGRIFVVYGEDKAAIADVEGDTQEEAKTNARLIAAAPDMYEALSFVGNQIKAWCDFRPELKLWTVVAQVTIRKALAKAEGKIEEREDVNQAV